MNRVRQRGFSLVEVFIGVLIIVGLAAGVWYILQSGGEPPPDKAHTPSSKAKPDNSYIEIREWGVRFKVPAALKGNIRYGIFAFTNGGQAAYFTSKKLAEHGCDLARASDASGSGTLGGSIALGRTKQAPEPPGEQSFKLGDYWYSVSFANGGACYEGDVGAETDAFNTQMDAALKQLEPAR
jgi:hypothetical protein